MVTTIYTIFCKQVDSSNDTQNRWGRNMDCLREKLVVAIYHTPAYRSWGDSAFPSLCPSVRPPICRRHGLRSVSQVCFWISIFKFHMHFGCGHRERPIDFQRCHFQKWSPGSHIGFCSTLALNIQSKLGPNVERYLYLLIESWFWMMFNCNPLIVHCCIPPSNPPRFS